ncbi:MAG TPA: hypothetical protein VF103_15740, partial [Polyangiaceae bacterium]
MGSWFDPRKSSSLFVYGACIAVGCSTMEPMSARDSGKGDDGFGANGAATGGSSGGGGTGAVPPPETEAEESYTAPAVSGHWIWTANPESGRVALIDAVTARVTTANAGLGPTYLAALRGNGDDESGAVVINVGSRDVSVFHSTNGAVDSG